MSQIPGQFNREPVHEENLKWLPRLGSPLYVPEGCLGCRVLSVPSAAVSAGTFSVLVKRGVEAGTVHMVPVGDEGDVIRELDRRANDAVNGQCGYIALQKECWRRPENDSTTPEIAR